MYLTVPKEGFECSNTTIFDKVKYKHKIKIVIENIRLIIAKILFNKLE